jgi:hypothetical protein
MNRNPNESPETTSPASTPVPLPPLRATNEETIRSAMWRGAKFGYLVYITIFATMYIAIGIFVAVSPVFRRALFSEIHGTILVHVAKAIGGLVALAVLGILYGALPGALVTGIGVAVRRRRNRKVARNDQRPAAQRRNSPGPFG